MHIYSSFSELVGHTPLLDLRNYVKKCGIHGRILAKLECFNPAGSSKDRAAVSMIDDAEKKGILRQGGTIIEPTSGNTGIGLAAVASSRGYKIILTMPDTMSVERRKLLEAYGAQVVLTPGKAGMQGAVEKAQELSETLPGSIVAGQFTNPANPWAHYKTTGPELWNDTDGVFDAFVAGIGTGGTLTGTGRYLKEKNPAIQIIGVEPAASPLISAGKTGAHKLQGIGANFVPDNYDPDVCDRIVTVTDSGAYEATRDLAACEGILVGITSGAAVCAAADMLRLPEFSGKTIVAFLPDSGNRYMSTGVFDSADRAPSDGTASR